MSQKYIGKILFLYTFFMYYQSLEYIRTFFKFNDILEENFLIKKFGRDTETACSSGDQCG